MAITAITNKIWMMPPVKNPPKKLIAQMITRTTAIIYNRLPMIKKFRMNKIVKIYTSSNIKSEPNLKRVNKTLYCASIGL